MLQYAPELLNHIQERRVLVGPVRNGPAILGEHDQLRERRVAPVAGLDDHADNAKATGVVQFLRALKLLLVAIGGSEVVRAEQGQEETGALKCGINLVGKAVTRQDLVIRPFGQQPIPAEHRQVLMEPLTPTIVDVRI